MDLYSSFYPVENSTNMRACLGQPIHAGIMCNYYNFIATNQDLRSKGSLTGRITMSHFANYENNTCTSFTIFLFTLLPVPIHS